MEIPPRIIVLFSDANGDSKKIKLDTKPFISGTIDSVINWMVLNPFGNIDMEDIKSGVTLFFLACRYNRNNDLIKWLIKTKETNLDFINSNSENVVEYLATSAFNSPKISSRIKLLLKLHPFNLDKKNKYGDTIFNILCYYGYIDIINYVLFNGYKLDNEKIIFLIERINQIITSKCNNYKYTNNFNNDYLHDSLQNILELLKSKLEN
jgi:hypothetical protein